eukprot:SAG31_NODE_590_length_13794_cov_22.123695_2_plen_62_part_00
MECELQRAKLLSSKSDGKQQGASPNQLAKRGNIADQKYRDTKENVDLHMLLLLYFSMGPLG